MRNYKIARFYMYLIELKAISKILNYFESQFLIDRLFDLMEPLIDISIEYDILIPLSTGEKI